jgi:hypothetical protein
MTTPVQFSLPGLPQATYPIRAYCRHCGHMAELVVDIEVLHSLNRLRCSQCDAGIGDIKIEQLSGVDLGG